jgi:hypothetical protein
LVVDRRGFEDEPCVGPGDPEGCSETPPTLLGPCSADPARAEVIAGGVRYQCEGGTFEIDAGATRLALFPLTSYAPYERYALRIAAGLTGTDGHARGVPLVAIFQAAGDLPLAPTDFEPGMFFAVIDTFEPIAAQFHFFFYLAVKPETGELRYFAVDADPIDPATDIRTNREPRDWKTDPLDGTGATLRAAGQVADGPDGRVIYINPFLLKVAVPPVEAVGTEVGARVRTATLAAIPGGARELIEGTMYSPAVFLGLDGERSDLGPGRGTALLFRMHPDEQPPLEDFLSPGVTVDEIVRPFGE